MTSGPRVRRQRKCSAANVLERSVICTNHSLTHTAYVSIQYVHVIHTCTQEQQQQLSGLLFIHPEADGGREGLEEGKRATEERRK